ncbi:MAG: hypothetical protein ACRDDW_00540 [Candidatus Rhabdochlamydia sp.]
MSIPPSKTQSAVVNNPMDHHDMSITSFMNQLSAENKLINHDKLRAFCMTQSTAVDELMGFRDFQKNYLGKIVVSNSEDKMKIHAILADESKQLSFQSLMKPTEQLYFQTMPPLEVLMKFCPKEPMLMNAPMSIRGESLNETGDYKMAILAGLVGTALIGASRVSTRFPTARKIAIIAGITINTIAVMYAIYNCKLHWNDKEGGKQKLNKVQSLISKLLSVGKKKFLDAIF